MQVWPNNKDFAFTIIDDTDSGSVENLKPIYNYLYKKGLLTTKTVWSYHTRDFFKGETMEDESYRTFIQELSKKGFEIASHGAGSGIFSREEIISHFESLNSQLEQSIKMHINHGRNADSIYWGGERFTFPINKIYNWIRKNIKKVVLEVEGSNPQSQSFWGDYAKKNIKYIRNRVYSGINTIKIDKKMPYIEGNKKKYSNYWFSSSDGYNCDTMVRLLSEKNIQQLIKEHGCSIIYTHFAYDFLTPDGELRKDFTEAIDRVAEKNGYFAPASDILDYLLEQKGKRNYEPSGLYFLLLDIKWFIERIYKKLHKGV